MSRTIGAAIEKRDLEQVRAFLDAGIDREARTAALRTATLERFLEAMELLLVAGCDVNTDAEPDIFWGLPLRCAYSDGFTEGFQLLREYGADPSFLGAPDAVALGCATIEGRAEDLERLLGNGGNPNLICLYDYPLLFIAARAGQTECVRVLLDAGANVHATLLPDPDGDMDVPIWTVLDVIPWGVFWHEPSPVRQLECLRLLLERGAPVNGVPQPEGLHWSPISAAINTMWAEGVRVFLEYGATVDANTGGLGLIGELHNTEVLQVLLESGLAQDQATMRQVWRGNHDWPGPGWDSGVTELLRKAGFQPNLYDAVLAGDTERVRALLAQRNYGEEDAGFHEALALAERWLCYVDERHEEIYKEIVDLIRNAVL